MREYEHPNDMINQIANDVLEKYRNSIPRKAFIEAMGQAANIAFMAREEENAYMRDLFWDAKGGRQQ